MAVLNSLGTGKPRNPSDPPTSTTTTPSYTRQTGTSNALSNATNTRSYVGTSYWAGGAPTSSGGSKAASAQSGVANAFAAGKNALLESVKNNGYATPKTDDTPDGGSPGGGTPRGGTSGIDASAYGGYSSTSDDIVNQIKQLLNEQKAAADEYYKTLYEQQIAQNKQQYRANQDQINLNRVRGRNYINQLYGDAISGPGISNRVRNDLNWASNSASNRLNYTNNDASALAAYNSGKANNASTLAQGWYNYVLPVYSNRQQNEDDYAYRRYLATL